MLIASYTNGFGIPSNEMQRSINGLGHGHGQGHGQGAGGLYANRIIPYDGWRPYHPNDARGQGYVGRWPPMYHGPKQKSLGDVPNDFEASVDLQYIPVRQGWYYGNPVDGSGYPDARYGLGADVAPAPVPSSVDALAQLAKAERTQTIFQIISTVSIATLATLAIIRAIRTARNGHEHPFFGDEDDDDDAAY